jgi:tRNA (guanine10-N2)-methyltransferase
MHFAAKHLRVGGRLVFWLPVITDTERQKNPPPQHPNLKLLSSSEQPFTQCISQFMSANLLIYR